MNYIRKDENFSDEILEEDASPGFIKTLPNLSKNMEHSPFSRDRRAKTPVANNLYQINFESSGP